MPANLTPEYKKAEQWYRESTSNEEKLLALERMLQVMPKHKGTEHLKADLHKKISRIKDASTQKGAGSSHVDIFHVPKTGAGQVVLLGTPNCGKSSLVGALSKAKVHITEFPYGTNAPVPGMAKYEDVQIQLVDMPPITADHVAPGQVGTYRQCDLIGIVIDLDGDIEGQWQVCIDFLESRRLILSEETGSKDDKGNNLAKKVFCVGTKVDVVGTGILALLQESCAYDFPFLEVSTTTGAGMDTFVACLFDMLEIIRIYSKRPGKPADMGDPFTLPRGSTVHELAYLIHRDLAEKLKTARIWGTGVYDGQNVQLDHVLYDKDVVELHFA